MKTRRSTAGRRRSAWAGTLAILAFGYPMIGCAVPPAGEPAGAGSAPAGVSPALAAAGMPPPRLGFSRRVFDAEINENDGWAALKLHAAAIGQADKLALDMGRPMFEGIAAMQRAMERAEIDLLALPTDEFAQLPEALVAGPLMLAVVAGRIADEYLVIVHRERGAGSVAALKGRTILLQHNARSSLSRIWLEVLALRAGFGPAARAFGRVTPVTKPTQAVLPVFFGQADAAVISRHSFQVMGELNPQVLREVRVLATSPAFVPSVMCFRAGVSPALVELVTRAVLKMHTTVSGRQVGTIFESDRLDLAPLAAVATARELVAEHARLLAAWSATPAAAAHPPGSDSP